MHKTFDLPITAEHICNGKRSNAFDCPAALALSDLGFHEVAVDHEETLLWDSNNEAWIIRHGNDLWAWIIDFDRGLSRGPETFRVQAITMNEYRSSYREEDY